MSFFSFIKTLLLTTAILFSSQVIAHEQSTDTEITQKINAKIAADNLLNHSKINVDVSTKDQVVTFTGVVNSDSEASALVEIAQSTVDVQDVNTTNLTVKGSTQPLTDLYITAKVKGKFIKEKLFGNKEVSAWTVHVETNNGVVTLTGEVDTKEEAENAIKLAQSVSGVSAVKYRVKVLRNHIPNHELTNY